MKAKKSLGQHFLKSKEALQNIVDAGDLKKGELVLEIGPGQGALTRELLSTGVKVVAVETDERMVAYLGNAFKNEIISGQLVLIHSRIEGFDIESLRSFAEKYKLIANIPYYITGEIIRMFLETSFQPLLMVLLVQKEVAERAVCRDDKQSILSLSIAYYGTAKYGGTVKSKEFNPPPKVDSAILIISDIKKEQEVPEDVFFKTIKEGFSYKRKVLTNNFKGETRNLIEKFLVNEKLPPKTRAEDLSITHWLKIADLIQTSTGRH